MKSELDYFPLNTEMDGKINYIESHFGLTGFAVIIKLYQKIYGDKGYYCTMTADEMSALAEENKISVDELEKIITAAVKKGLFDEDLFNKYQILTSSGIQKRYFKLIKRRNDTEINENFLLYRFNTLKNVCNVCNVNIQKERENEKEKRSKREKDKEIRKSQNTIKESEKKESSKISKTNNSNNNIINNIILYGEFENVKLSDAELEKLKARTPQAATYIEKLSSYIASTGKKYKSHYATLLNWIRKDEERNAKNNLQAPASYNINEYRAKEKQTLKYERKNAQ